MAKYKKFKKEFGIFISRLRIDRYNASQYIQPVYTAGYSAPVDFLTMRNAPPAIKIFIDGVELELTGDYGSIDKEKIYEAARDNKTFELELKIK